MTIQGADLVALVTQGVLETSTDIPSASSSSATETPLDKKFKKIVPKIINKYGVTLTFGFDKSEYNVATGNIAESDTSFVEVNGLPPFSFKENMIDGQIVQHGDMMTGIAANGLTFTPLIGQRVKAPNQPEMRIINVRPILSGTLAALYLFHLRK